MTTATAHLADRDTGRHLVIDTGIALEDTGLDVHVYRNLTKGVWSVRSSGRVIAHRPRIVLRNCKMHVRESGRQRAIRDGYRNVHAWVSGEPCRQPLEADLIEIGYN